MWCADSDNKEHKEVMYDPNKWSRPGYARAAIKANLQIFAAGLVVVFVAMAIDWIFKP